MLLETIKQWYLYNYKQYGVPQINNFFHKNIFNIIFDYIFGKGGV